jgi:hypothetical protein
MQHQVISANVLADSADGEAQMLGLEAGAAGPLHRAQLVDRRLTMQRQQQHQHQHIHHVMRILVMIMTMMMIRGRGAWP